MSRTRNTLNLEHLELRALMAVDGFQIPSPPAVGPAQIGPQFVDPSPGESVFDLDLFEQNVRNNFVGNSVGFAYSINYQGQIGARHDGWGDARIAADDPQQDFTEGSRMTIASVAKTITATAMLKLIQDQGMSVDDPIAPYLPSDWELGPCVGPCVTVTPSGLTLDPGITFRDLLTHHSGIRRIDFDGSGSASLTEQTSYDGLRQLIAAGIDLADKPVHSYENANFALMRVMLPYVWNAVDNDLLEFLPSLPLNQLLGIGPDDITAQYYKQYVRTEVFEPMGIFGADTAPTENDPTRNYPFPDDGSGSIQYGDRTLLSGGEGWFLSADELAAFLHHVRYEDTVLNQATRQMMTGGFLGWNDPQDYGWSEGMFGTYYNHGGDLNKLNTVVMSFPNTAQVALLLNSDFVGADVPHAGAYSGAYQAQLMQRAFENAWPEITLAGTPGDDTFELRRNEGDAGSVDIFINGELVVTRWVETLDRLTLNGLAGDDEFIIDDVPASLELFLNGGADDDSFFIGDGDVDSTDRGDVEIDGGSGNDSLSVNDLLDTNFEPHTPLPPGIPDFYFLTSDSLSKIGFEVVYSGLQSIRLDASQQNNVIEVLSTAHGTTYELYANNGFDVFNIGDGDFDSNIRGNVLVDGGFGPDTVFIDDSEDNLGNDTHTLDASSYTKSSTAQTVEFFWVQQFRLDTGSSDETVDVFSTFDLDSLTMNTAGGVDTVNVHAVAPATEVQINTGGANDTIELSPADRNLDAIQGVVRADMGGGFFDEILLNDDDDSGHDTYNFWERRFDTSGFGNLYFDRAERVDLRANGGNNQINIRRLHEDVHLTVRAMGGDDDIIVGYGTADLDTYLLGDLTLRGGDGRDLVWFRDYADTGNDTYRLSSSAFTKTGTDDWTLAQAEEIQLSANDFDNTIEVSQFGSLFDDHEMLIHANDGDDNIVLGAGFGRIDFIFDHVFVNGGFGTDQLTIDDRSAVSAREYTHSGQTLDASGLFGSVSYLSIGAVVIEAGDHGDHFDIQSSIISTDLELHGYGGNDTFEIAPDEQNLAFIGGDLLVNGGDGADSLTLHDENTSGGDSFEVTFSTVTKPGFALSYFEVEELTLNTGTGDDVVHVQGTLATTSMAVHAGPGDDVVHLADSSGNLSLLAGAVTVHGNDGADDVILHDELFGLGALFPYTILRSRVERGIFGGLTFDTIELARLIMGPGNDTVHVREFNPDIVFDLLGNDGNDMFNVSVRPSHAVPSGGRLLIDSGSPTKARGGDRLHVSYVPSPAVAQHEVPNDPDAGHIQLTYPEALFDIVYDDIEQVLVEVL